MVRAEAAHVAPIVARLRPEDAETFAASGRDPEAAIIETLARSSVAGVALLDGAPVAVWSAVPDCLIAPASAHVWLLISGLIERRPAAIVARRALSFLDAVQNVYGVLTTSVPEHHEADRRWLEFAGFRALPGADDWLGPCRLLGYVRGMPWA